MKLNGEKNRRPKNTKPALDWTFEPQFLVSPLHARLPDKLFREVLSFTDRYIADENSKDYSNNLAGHIKQGQQIELPLADAPPQFLDLLLNLTTCYIDTQNHQAHAQMEPYELSFVDMWVVSQREKDFNPIHQHGAEISGILYLKVPEQINPKKFPEGYLEFVHGRSKPETLDFCGSRAVLPVPGNLYIFPAWLQHIVYPFYGEGERRSLSFNIKVTIT